MKTATLMTALIVMVAMSGVFVLAQEAKQEEKPDGKQVEKQAEKQPEVDVSKVIDRLGADDFAARKRAEADLVALGKKAVPALEKAAKEHEDAHVRFEAGRLLNKILAAEKSNEKALSERDADEGTNPRRRALEDMIRRMEESGLLGEAELERLRKLIEDEDAWPGQRGLGGGLSFGGEGEMQGQVITGDRKIDYRRDKEGHIVVKITEDGETRTYEADSLEQLKKEHPEVHALVEKHFRGVQVFSGRSPFGFKFDFPGPDWPRMPELPRRFGESPLRERKAEIPGGFRLGIWIGDVSEALRAHLKLSKSEGVLVEEVVRGSLADRVGLLRLDVIRKVNGVPVVNAPAVRREVEKIGEGEKITLEIIRKGDPLTLIGTR
jgi:hypothetical protein